MASTTTAWRAIQQATARCAGHPLVREPQRVGFVARGAVYAVVEGRHRRLKP